MLTVDIDALKKFELFEGLNDIQLAWILNHATIQTFDKDAVVFKTNEVVEVTAVLLEGRLQVLRAEPNGVKIPIITYLPGAVTGMLPYSRMTKNTVDLVALDDVVVLTIHMDNYRELENNAYEFHWKLVDQMKARIRVGASHLQQRDKLESLGKLASGIAHEINNPTSAITRTASALQESLEESSAIMAEVFSEHPLVKSLHQIKAWYNHCCKDRSVALSKLSMLEKNEKVDDITFFLEDLGLDEPEDMAEVLVEIGVNEEDLYQLKDQIDPEFLLKGLRWFVKKVSIQKGIEEIHQASKRISDLVGSIKSYSHMDKAPTFAPIAIKEGLANTIIMLNHKIKTKNITLKLNIPDDLPKVNAMEGELNQVWTNIIDNAIDAVQREGEISIDTCVSNAFLEVNISDNGPGIPEDIKTKIFDPFFTTKGVGKGTGLGLDIVQRIIQKHNGKIDIKDDKELTTFNISLPIYRG